MTLYGTIVQCHIQYATGSADAECARGTEMCCYQAMIWGKKETPLGSSSFILCCSSNGK